MSRLRPACPSGRCPACPSCHVPAFNRASLQASGQRDSPLAACEHFNYVNSNYVAVSYKETVNSAPLSGRFDTPHLWSAPTTSAPQLEAPHPVTGRPVCRLAPRICALRRRYIIPPASASADRQHPSIDRPREQVFDYLSDIANHAEFTDHFLKRVPTRAASVARRGRRRPLPDRLPARSDLGGERAGRARCSLHRIVLKGRAGRIGRIRIRTEYRLTGHDQDMTQVELTYSTRARNAGRPAEGGPGREAVAASAMGAGAAPAGAGARAGRAVLTGGRCGGRVAQAAYTLRARVYAQACVCRRWRSPSCLP